jgi:NDP-sugar pyrophosphorylase family protein
MPAPSIRQAAILAGGLGTRIAGISGGRPKVLLPIAGRPFLAHLLEFLAGQGIAEAVLLLGVGASEVRAAAEGSRPSGLTLVVSAEPEPLGTGGALKFAEPLFDTRFFLVNGDTFFRTDYAALAARHEAARREGVVATLALTRVSDAAEKGSVEVGPADRIVRFVEKGRSGSGLINAGVYLIEKEGLCDIPLGRPVSLERETLPLWMARESERGLLGVETAGWFVDIGLPEDYLKVKDGFPQA